MSVKIDINKPRIRSRVNNAWRGQLPVLSEQVLKDCNKYAKLDQGPLIASSQTASDLQNGVLVWDTPYAARQHWEIQTAYKDKNPNASWHWKLVAKSKHKKQWNKLAQKEFDKRL